MHARDWFNSLVPKRLVPHRRNLVPVLYLSTHTKPLATTALPLTATASPLAVTASPFAVTASSLAVTASPLAAAVNPCRPRAYLERERTCI